MIDSLKKKKKSDILKTEGNNQNDSVCVSHRDRKKEMYQVRYGQPTWPSFVPPATLLQPCVGFISDLTNWSLGAKWDRKWILLNMCSNVFLASRSSGTSRPSNNHMNTCKRKWPKMSEEAAVATVNTIEHTENSRLLLFFQEGGVVYVYTL